MRGESKSSRGKLIGSAQSNKNGFKYAVKADFKTMAILFLLKKNFTFHPSMVGRGRWISVCSRPAELHSEILCQIQQQTRVCVRVCEREDISNFSFPCSWPSVPVLYTGNLPLLGVSASPACCKCTTERVL